MIYIRKKESDFQDGRGGDSLLLFWMNCSLYPQPRLIFDNIRAGALWTASKPRAGARTCQAQVLCAWAAKNKERTWYR